MGVDCSDPPPGWSYQYQTLLDSQAHTGLDRRLICQIKNYRIEDISAKRKKATPLGIVHSIVAAGASASNPKTHNIADLVQL